MLSTLHTNTAIGAITRLVNMGLESFLIASTIQGILAQRLVRVLCDECKKPIESDEFQTTMLKQTKPTTIYQPVGCTACEHIGFKGRTGIYEVITLDAPLRNLISQNVSEVELTTYISQNFTTLFDSGRQLVLQGKTTIDEVLSVVKET